MTKSVVAFRNFANAPEKLFLFLYSSYFNRQISFVPSYVLTFLGRHPHRGGKAVGANKFGFSDKMKTMQYSSRIPFKKFLLKELNLIFPKSSSVINICWTTKRLLFVSRKGWRFSSYPERSVLSPPTSY